MNRKQEVEKLGKHMITTVHMEQIRQFFKDYNENMTEEQALARYAGILGKGRSKVLPRSRLYRIWNRFMEQERRDFIIAHNTMSMDMIMTIGIDKFVRTCGWESPIEVGSWRNNVVRVGVCPECNDQFIPLMFQTNQGLCNNCRPNFSIKAIRRFIEFVTSTNERYANASKDAMMDFYIMFYSDSSFRQLFREGSDSAKEYEEQAFVIPEWFEAEREIEMERLQQQLIEMVPEDGDK